jgi:hypothetical protein
MVSGRAEPRSRGGLADGARSRARYLSFRQRCGNRGQVGSTAESVERHGERRSPGTLSVPGGEKRQAPMLSPRRARRVRRGEQGGCLGGLYPFRGEKRQLGKVRRVGALWRALAENSPRFRVWARAEGLFPQRCRWGGILLSRGGDRVIDSLDGDKEGSFESREEERARALGLRATVE